MVDKKAIVVLVDGADQKESAWDARIKNVSQQIMAWPGARQVIVRRGVIRQPSGVRQEVVLFERAFDHEARELGAGLALPRESGNQPLATVTIDREERIDRLGNARWFILVCWTSGMAALLAALALPHSVDRVASLLAWTAAALVVVHTIWLLLRQDVAWLLVRFVFVLLPVSLFVLDWVRVPDRPLYQLAWVTAGAVLLLLGNAVVLWSAYD